MNKVKNTAIICGVISMVATIAFYLLAFEDLFDKPNGWLPLLLLLVAELVGIVKVFAAASSAVCHMDKISKMDQKTKKKLSKLHKKYKAIILDEGERKLDNISDIVGRDYNTTKQDIQGMINQEILKHAFINDVRREVMFIAPADGGCNTPNVHLHVNQISNASANPTLTSNPTTDNNINFSKQGSDNSCNHNNTDSTSAATVTETETTTGNVHNAPGAIVIPTIRPRVVVCPCCGANNIVVGEVGQCEYCLAPLA